MNLMLSVDLEGGVTSEQRRLFNAELAKMNYQKDPTLTTVWTATWDNATEDSAYKNVLAVVSGAATTAKITQYRLIAQFGTTSAKRHSQGVS